MRHAKEDTSSVSFTPDEQLALLCGALLKLAETANYSRWRLAELMQAHDYVDLTARFEAGDGERREVRLGQELDDSALVLERVKSLLVPAMAEIRELA